MANGIQSNNGKKCGRPRFKSRCKYKSFSTAKYQAGYPSIPSSLSLERSDTVWVFGVRGQAGWKPLPVNHIKIGKRVYCYFKSREIQGILKRCTIKRDAVGDVYICILTDPVEPDQNRVMTGPIARFDLNLKRYLNGLQRTRYRIASVF